MNRSLWTPLHAKLHGLIRQRSLLKPHQAILVAVSGGQDSLCLAKLLLDLQPKWHWQLAIAHCDHRWRTDSQANADHVAQLAQTWNLPFYLETASLPPNSEATAREWRYGALSNLAESHHYSAIVTGHTASDRAETLLFNLMRGSGADGLRSLGWSRTLTPTLTLVRPLLFLTRTETEQFCQTESLPIWQDTTNDDRTFARNRIRHELLPYLKQHFNPKAEQHLAQTMDLLAEDVAYLEQSAFALQEAAAHPTKPALHRPTLAQASLALQRRAVRQFLQMTLSIAPNFEQVEKVIALIAAPQRSRTDPFIQSTIAQVEGEWIVLTQLP